MTNSFMAVPVPAVPPQPPQVTLIDSAVKPPDTADFQGDAVTAEQLASLPTDLRAELNARGGKAWTRAFTYAPENHYSAEIRDRCDFSTVDSPALPAPTGLALSPVAGGSLVAGTYSYQVTATDVNGETTALAAVPITTVSTGSVKLTWAPTAEGGGGEPGGVSYNIYGRIGGSIGKIAGPLKFDLDQTPTYTDASATAVGAAPPGANTTGGPGVYTNLPINTVVPFVVVAEDWCSSWGWSERDFKGRASRLLENAKYQAVEKEFWTGTLAQAKGYPNRYLTDSNLVDITAGTPVSTTRGLQLLQDYLQQTGFGGQGMIHCQPQTAPNLLGARRVGNLLLDVFDNIIVPGVGYPGTASGISGTTTNTAVMIATDLVGFREEDEPTVVPDTFSEALDWGQGGFPNTIRFRAMKFAAAYFDGAVQGGVRVTLAT